MSPKQALAFVKKHGVVLQAARGPVPSLAEAVAGEPIRGSWWGHPKGQAIFLAAEAIGESPDVLVCKLVEGKVTYVHRRLWPALVRLASSLPEGPARQGVERAHRERRASSPTRGVPGLGPGGRGAAGADAPAHRGSGASVTIARDREESPEVSG